MTIVMNGAYTNAGVYRVLTRITHSTTTACGCVGFGGLHNHESRRDRVQDVMTHLLMITSLICCGLNSLVLAADVPDKDSAQFAVPTRSDRIGRIVIPVRLNDRGPFLLMLDTGATHSVITKGTAQQLDVDLGAAENSSVQGVMGRVIAPVARISELRAGSLKLHDLTMPIIDSAIVTELDGILGAEGLMNKVVTADFINDRIRISDSTGQRPVRSYGIIKFDLVSHRLIVVDAMVGRFPVRAVIDTGGSETIGNLPLLKMLSGGTRSIDSESASNLIDVTNTTRGGRVFLVPRIKLDAANITNAAIVAGDFEIFRVWKLDQSPALLIGMDVLGQLGELSIDYKRQELWILER